MPTAVRRLNGVCVVLGLAIWLEGCSPGPSRILPPAISPENAADAAIDAYDHDGDGALSKKELKKCPALLNAIASYDTNENGEIECEEIAARLTAWEETRVGITAATFYVKLDGRPLTGARVLLEPEPFLAEAVLPASAEINSSGLASPSIAAEYLPESVRYGLHSGLYKIKISHPKLKIQAEVVAGQVGRRQ